MRPEKLVGAIFILSVLFGSLPLTIMETEVVSAQGAGGYFEGLVPIQGHYLRAINTYPGVTPDSDGDGELDKGCTWDDNGDGVGDQHVVRDPLIVDLATNEFNPGDNVMISFKQSIYANTGDIFAFHVYGLFSTSKDLLREDYTYTSSSGEKWPMVGPLNRVPGAIDAALGGYVHGPQDDTNTWKQGREVENDIPQDFRIGGYQETNGWKNYDKWSQDKEFFSSGFWMKIPPGAKFLFFEVAGYWNVGDAGYCRVKVDKDTDVDAIPDSWEKNGIDFNWDGTVDLKLAGSDYLKKDIYVEVDYMQGHKPNQAALDDVVAAFRNCPETVEDGPINLHPEVDTTTMCPHYDYLRFEDVKDFKAKAGFGTFDQQKSANSKFILLAKKYTYHYCLFVHSIEVKKGTVWTKTTAGGIGEWPGNDFVVSLGNWTGGVGSRDEQSCVFMHELGHNLGLGHGGADDVNYKPNYLSIMNYQFQLPYTLRGRPLTYSSAKLRTLTETGLDETTGLNAANWDWTVYSALLHTADGSKYVPLVVSTLGGIDWNNDGDEEDTYTQANINNFPKRGYANTDDEILYGYDDWTNLNFYYTETGGFAGSLEGLDIDDVEMTWELAQAIQEEAKNMVGGPTGPVQIIDTPTEPSPEEEDSGPQTQNPFFIFFDQATSFLKSNPIIAGVAIASVIGAVVVSSVVKRKKKRKTQ